MEKMLKQRKIKLKPDLGDIREIKRFAILPIRINKDKTVWLRFYKQRQTYSKLYKYFLDSYAGTIGYKIYNKWVDDYNSDGYPVVNI